jgi:hypothetical protein
MNVEIDILKVQFNDVIDNLLTNLTMVNNLLQSCYFPFNICNMEKGAAFRAMRLKLSTFII